MGLAKEAATRVHAPRVGAEFTVALLATEALAVEALVFGRGPFVGVHHLRAVGVGAHLAATDSKPT